MTGARRARPDGLGAAFAQESGVVSLLLAFVTTAGAGYLLLGLKGLAALAAVALFTACGRMFFQRKLGGLTGDTIGCISECNEIIALIVISALPVNMM